MDNEKEIRDEIEGIKKWINSLATTTGNRFNTLKSVVVLLDAIKEDRPNTGIIKECQESLVQAISDLKEGK